MHSKSRGGRGRLAGVLLGALLLVPALPAGAADSEAEVLARLARKVGSGGDPKAHQELADFVLRLQDAELRTQAALALGLDALAGEKWARARDWLEIAAKGKLLGDYGAYYRARAAFQQERFEEAGAVLGGSSFAGSVLEDAARELRSDAFVQMGRAGQAVTYLETLPGLAGNPALQLAYGKALLAGGRLGTAGRVLRRVYFDFPLSSRAAPARELLEGLRSESGEKTAKPGPDDWLRRAGILWKKREYRWAREAYLQAAEQGGSWEEKQFARFRAVSAHYFLGAQTAACRELRGLGAVPSRLEGERRALLARCDLRARRWKQADGHLDFLRGEHPALPEYGSAILAAARTAWLRDSNRRALGYYKRFVAEFPESRRFNGAHWRLAWATYREGDRTAAARLMEEHALLSGQSRSGLYPRALYWRARLAETGRDEPLAQFLFATLIEAAPRNYLAQLGREHLRKLRGSPAASPSLPAWVDRLPARSPVKAWPPLPSVMRVRLEKSAALSRLGLSDLADGELAFGLRVRTHPALWYERARLAFARDEYARAVEFTRRAYPGYLVARLHELPREAWEMLFPLPYWEQIEREANRRGLDPYLVAGLIRQESRFEREAVSSVGALGLMQLMMPTARELARSRRLSRTRVLTPDFNIRLGVQHLARLLRRFDGSVEKALAAYNGGGTRVARWTRDKDFPADTAAFVESIPFDQTRNFVYIILRNHRFYRDLYAER